MSTRNDSGAALREAVELGADGQAECWRDVPGHEGQYRVSDLGRVKSVDRVVMKGDVPVLRKGKMLKFSRNRQGYPLVKLVKNAKGRNIAVHQLVLFAFVGPRPDGHECRHFPNDDKSDNRLSNLAWGTKSENWHDRVEHGTSNRGERHPSATLTEVEVREMRRLHATGHYSYAQLMKTFHTTYAIVGYVIRRDRWKYVE